MSQDESRRRFLKKAVYVPPMILSFKAVPAFARPGSVIEHPQGKVTMTEDLLDRRLGRDSEKAGWRGLRQEGASLEPVEPGHLERRGVVEGGEKRREQSTGLSLPDDQLIKGADAMSGSIPVRKGSS